MACPSRGNGNPVAVTTYMTRIATPHATSRAEPSINPPAIKSADTGTHQMSTRSKTIPIGIASPHGDEPIRLTDEQARRERAAEREAVSAEGLEQRSRHNETDEHEREQQDPHHALPRIEVVREPGDVDPRRPHREEKDERLDRAAKAQVIE